MTIDWTKPLELEDGTPVVLDYDHRDGDYSLRRADGEEFTYEQAGNNPHVAIWKKDGSRYGGNVGLRVRNAVETTSDIPQWALKRVYTFTEPEDAYTAFARYIAQHEQPPVDPDLLTAREICAKAAEGFGLESAPASYRNGDYDNDSEVQFALSKLKEARG